MENDDRPRSSEKARLLKYSKALAETSAVLHHALSDNFLPDDVCRSLAKQARKVLKELEAITGEADGHYSAAAPQAGRTVLSEAQEKDGRGKLKALPPEVRGQVWTLLSGKDLCRLSALSRAANNDVLPRIMTHVALRSTTRSSEASQRAMANAVGRLADRGKLLVKTLEVEGSFNLTDAIMMSRMATTVQKLIIAAPLVEQDFKGLAAPLVEVLDLELTVQLESAEWGELHIEAGDGLIDIDTFIPADAQLKQLKLMFRLQGPKDVDDEDGGHFLTSSVDIDLGTGPLRRHTTLKSLVFCAECFGACRGAIPRLHLVDGDGEVPVRLCALSAIAILPNQQTFSTGYALSRLQSVLDLAPNLTRLYLDIEWEESHPLPTMPALRALALPESWLGGLAPTVNLEDLTSLTLLGWCKRWSEQRSGLAAFEGALSIGRTRAITLASDAFASFRTRHFHVGIYDTGNTSWSRIADLLPSGLETLSHEPDEDGYIFRWVNRDYENSKAFNRLFGTLATYENDWWDDD